MAPKKKVPASYKGTDLEIVLPVSHDGQTIARELRTAFNALYKGILPTPPVEMSPVEEKLLRAINFSTDLSQNYKRFIRSLFVAIGYNLGSDESGSSIKTACKPMFVVRSVNSRKHHTRKIEFCRNIVDLSICDRDHNKAINDGGSGYLGYSDFYGIPSDEFRIATEEEAEKFVTLIESKNG